MTEPTDADRTRAAELWALDWPPAVDRIAAALASERAAAVADLRARVLALADQLHRESPDQEAWDGNVQVAYRDIAACLRAAVTDATGGRQ